MVISRRSSGDKRTCFHADASALLNLPSDFLHRQKLAPTTNTSRNSFKPLTPQTLALVAAAIECALSQHATRMKVTDMFSQD